MASLCFLNCRTQNAKYHVVFITGLMQLGGTRDLLVMFPKSGTVLW